MIRRHDLHVSSDLAAVSHVNPHRVQEDVAEIDEDAAFNVDVVAAITVQGGRSMLSSPIDPSSSRTIVVRSVVSSAPVA